MKIPFNFYDFLGYAFPGFVVIIIAFILTNPDILTTPQSPEVPNPDATPTIQTEPAKSGLERSLPTNIYHLIFYVLACYLVGLAVHGFTDWLFATLSKKWERLKRYYSDQGAFERGLFGDSSNRDDPIDFVPYSDHFVDKLKTQIEKIFDVKVDSIMPKAGDQVDDQKYTEIFEFCRSAVIERSPTHYSRAFALLSLYNSARLLGVIFLFAAVGFLARIFVPQQHFEGIWAAVYFVIFLLLWIGPKGEKLNECAKKRSKKGCTKAIGFAYWIGGVLAAIARLWTWIAACILQNIGFAYWIGGGVLAAIAGGWIWIADHIPQNEVEGFKILFWGYCVSAALCPIFFYLYNLFRRYYRNSIIYGFYEYAVTREKGTEKSNAT